MSQKAFLPSTKSVHSHTPEKCNCHFSSSNSHSGPNGSQVNRSGSASAAHRSKSRPPPATISNPLGISKSANRLVTTINPSGISESVDGKANIANPPGISKITKTPKKNLKPLWQNKKCQKRYTATRWREGGFSDEKKCVRKRHRSGSSESRSIKRKNYGGNLHVKAHQPKKLFQGRREKITKHIIEFISKERTKPRSGNTRPEKLAKNQEFCLARSPLTPLTPLHLREHPTTSVSSEMSFSSLQEYTKAEGYAQTKGAERSKQNRQVLQKTRKLTTADREMRDVQVAHALDIISRSMEHPPHKIDKYRAWVLEELKSNDPNIEDKTGYQVLQFLLGTPLNIARSFWHYVVLQIHLVYNLGLLYITFYSTPPVAFFVVGVTFFWIKVLYELYRDIMHRSDPLYSSGVAKEMSIAAAISASMGFILKLKAQGGELTDAWWKGE